MHTLARAKRKLNWPPAAYVGPRRPGEGTENEEQGIVDAELQPGGASLHITLLAAGFIIGEKPHNKRATGMHGISLPETSKPSATSRMLPYIRVD